MKHITVGVAGHIDHGKTALVRALTGMETDRLKEEQERGMSIVLGFAHLSLPEGEVDMIDVPGHERFVHTMIAGATGMEAVLLVVSANESVMPQTREHVALTELLGVQKGLVVITKGDLAPDTDERALVEEEAREFLAGTFLQDAPTVWTSAVTGEGLDELREALRGLLRQAAPPPELPYCYLPIDRVFTMAGHGTVVTGTLRRGALRVGQGVEIVPGARRAEVRGLEVHGRGVAQAEPGWRTAVNLRGVKKEDIGRGDALATPDALRPTRLLDVELQTLPGVRPLRRGQTVRLHYGTGEALARVHPLDRDEMVPGERGLAQLRLADEVMVPVQERFVIRAVSPVETLGGGVIVDAAPQRHRRADADALRRVRALSAGAVVEKVREKLLEAREAGQEVAHLAAGLALTPVQADAALAEMPVVRAGGLALHQTFFDDLCRKASEAVHQFHAAHPTQRGMPREELRRRLPAALAPPLFGRVLDELVRQGRLEATDALVKEVGFSPAAMLTAVERAIAQEIEEQFRRGGLHPPNLKDVLGQDRRRKNLYHYLRESGRLVETLDRTSNRVVTFHCAAVAEAERRLEQALASGPGATVSELNQVLGTTRKNAIPLLEHFDARGVTKRVGDARVWGGG
ncbi:MAG: selenocysteine-specific translation elongation factor [Armatimonadetes bacterium]|nr:selenocysteine-specific translation elongation factor [Armatimonadota bacterium]